MAEDEGKGIGLVILGIVAIVAVIGLVLMFARPGLVGAWKENQGAPGAWESGYVGTTTEGPRATIVRSYGGAYSGEGAPAAPPEQEYPYKYAQPGQQVTGTDKSQLTYSYS